MKKESIIAMPACPGNKALQFMILKLGILVLLLGIVYFDTAVSLVKLWSSRDDYSHGFIVPFVSAFLVWHMRHRLQGIPVRPALLWGTLLTLCGLLTLLLGHVGSAPLVQQFSLLVTIPGLVWLLFGTDYLKALALPLTYLLFMVPVLDVVLDFDSLHLPFQYFAATVATKALQLFGIPAIQDFTFIDLPDQSLEVANACSGLRYLISILAVGVPLAHVTQRTLRRQALLIGSAVLIGIFANPVRVTLIGAWVSGGGELTHGPFHLLQGLFVSVIGFVCLFVLAFRLQEKSVPDLGASLAGDYGIEQHVDATKTRLAWAGAFILLLVLGGYLHISSPLPVPAPEEITALPLILDDWTGTETSPAEQFRLTGADFELCRSYRNAAGQEVTMQLSYFSQQRPDKKLLHYKLQILDRSSVSLHADGAAIRKAHLAKQGQALAVVYWYNIDGHVTANRYQALVVSAVNGLIRKRTNGYFVVVTARQEENMTEQQLAFSALLSRALR